jgi:peptide/nickel transport system permease protein
MLRWTRAFIMVVDSPAARVRRTPTSRARSPWRTAAGNTLFVVGSLILAGFLTMATAPGLLTRRSPTMIEAGQMFRPPGPRHLLGTDRFGRDVFTRVVYGARVSLGIAGISVSGALAVGGSLGLLGGYAGGWTDQVLGRLMDLFFAFPPILLALAIAAVMGAGSVAAVTAIGVVYAPLFFRVVRGSVLAERELAYVEAARALGARPLGIMVRHILRNILSPVIVQVAVTLSYAVLIESALSYLGVGVQPPTPSWGTTLNEGKEFLQLAPWVSIFPGLAIMFCVLSFNFLSDGMRDLFDPRLRQR